MDVRSQINWARKEAEILKKETKSEGVERMADTAESAYEIVLANFYTDSYKEAQQSMIILKRLIDGLPLTPITEENADWQDFNGKADMKRSGRYRNLFKVTSKDGDAYVDASRFKLFNIGDEGQQATPDESVVITTVAEELMGVELPYLPGLRKTMIFYERFEHEDSHILAITHYLVEGFIVPNPIGRYFKETSADECDINTGEGKWVEIDKETYNVVKFKIQKATETKEEK